MFICGEWVAEKLKGLSLLPELNFAFVALVTKMFFLLNLTVGTDIRLLCQANFNGLKMKEHRRTVNRRVYEDLIAQGIPEEFAQKAVLAIAGGKVQDAHIKY